MSDLSSFKTVPPLAKQPSAKVLEVLSNPSSLAVIASLGVHALLWFGLPLLPSASKQANTQRQVRVIELSPLEQARLPQATLPPLTSSPQLTDPLSSGVPPAPPDPTITAPAPNSTTYYPIPGLDTPSDRSSTPPSTNQPSKKSPSKTNKTAQSNTSEQTQSNTSDDEIKSGEPSKRAEDLLPSPDDKSEKNTDDPEKQRLALQQSYAYNATGTTDQTYRKNFETATDEVAGKLGIRDWGGKPIKTQAAYPKEACQFRHDGKPVKGDTGFVVVLRPDGTLAEETWLLRSSGFKGLDDAAAKFLEKQWSQVAKKNEIEPGKNPKAYTVVVTFDPTETDCAGAPKTS